MNIIVLGRSPITVLALQALYTGKWQSSLGIAALVSNDDTFSRIRSLCHERLPAHISDDMRNEDAILSAITKYNIDILLSVQHKWVLSSSVIEAVHGNAFNLHNAKLPDYEGYNCISHAILNGDQTYTTTIHWMTEDVDTGDLAFEETIPLSETDTAFSLYGKTLPAAVLNIEKLAHCLATGHPVPRKPMSSGGRFYGKTEITSLKKIQCVEDLDETSIKARAFYFPPHEPAYFEIGSSRLYVTPEYSTTSISPPFGPHP